MDYNILILGLIGFIGWIGTGFFYYLFLEAKNKYNELKLYNLKKEMKRVL